MTIPRDKIQHLAVGFAVAFVVGLVHPLLGVVACYAAAGGKELYDRRHPQAHTFDGWDAFWTAAGSLPALALIEVLRAVG